MKILLLLSLMTIVIHCPTNAENDFSWWNKPLEAFLDMSCVTFIVLPLQYYDQVSMKGLFKRKISYLSKRVPCTYSIQRYL